MTTIESVLISNKHILIYFNDQTNTSKELEYIKNHFCGIVFDNITSFNNHSIQKDSIIYLCGNIKNIFDEIHIDQDNKIYIIENLSYNYNENHKLIHSGQVPININNGVYFRGFFNSDKNYFDLVNTEHKFQALTESNHPTNAYRTGIYLTNVEEKHDEIKFKLLRCSSNLRGPTDNFQITDNDIINQANNISKHFFTDSANLNHVLAQIYANKIVEIDGKSLERKSKIKDHSDKTKDMPKNGLIAFCTFYKFNNDIKQLKTSDDNIFNLCYKNTSVFTKLRFRLKKTQESLSLEKQFDVVLYPNSMFIISLQMNRLYTHEIIPSILPINFLPTRMGYVIRCSNVSAVFKNNKTYIVESNKQTELQKPTDDEIKKLKQLYLKENLTDELIEYPQIYFSLNDGDYLKPLI